MPMSTERTASSKPMKIYLDLETAVLLEIATMDPLTHKPRYGARSMLIERLVRKYLQEIGFDIKGAPLTNDQINAIGADQ